jgi:hypothetical protein
MAEEVSPKDAVEAAVLRQLQEEYENAAIVTGWVIVAEFMTSEGAPDIHAFAADHMPYWKINGMLDAAPHEMVYAYDDEDEDEEL